MLVSTYTLFFEYDFKHINIDFFGEDNPFSIDSYIGMMEVISSEHLEK